MYATLADSRDLIKRVPRHARVYRFVNTILTSGQDFLKDNNIPSLFQKRHRHSRVSGAAVKLNE